MINSWAKFYEILAKTGVLDLPSDAASGARRVVKSVHLCECPGGFVAATNHFLKTRPEGALLHSWRAASLNPYFEGASPLEALDDDVLFRQTERRWVVGPDGSGDIRRRANIEALWQQLTRKSSHPNAPPPFGLVGHAPQLGASRRSDRTGCRLTERAVCQNGLSSSCFVSAGGLGLCRRLL